MRLINFLVICALIAAASVVYKIKFDSTLQAENVAKLRNELRDERNAIASLRAEWNALNSPGRIQGLADRHLVLKPIRPKQFDDFSGLSERSPLIMSTPNSDPIGVMLAPPVSRAVGSVSIRTGG